MKCDMCGIKEATVHLTEVINDESTKMHLCEQCAKTKSEEMHSHFGLTDLLSGLMDMGPAVSDGMSLDVDVQCPRCDLTYFDFQKNGRLGCGKCYDAFSKNLSELLRKIHGSDRHVGKTPFKGPALKDGEDLQRLNRELNDLIGAEEFEKAALLRDRIREIEKKFNKETDTDGSQ